MPEKKIIIVAGPTASGKTAYSLKLAMELQCPIISADSRQIYHELSIGTAKPGPEDLHKVRHYFINHISIVQPYDVGIYADELEVLLEELFRVYNTLIVCGGTGLYIHAIMNGLDKFPDVDPLIRLKLRGTYEELGITELQRQLLELDPEYYNTVDLQNSRRLMRALEICLSSGQAYSSFLQNKRSTNKYNFEKIYLHLEREELYNRINSRVDQMLQAGLIDEVKNLIPYRNHQALNTVGYKEVFDFLDNKIDYDSMVEKIKQHTRNYAKRQITWFKKYFDN